MTDETLTLDKIAESNAKYREQLSTSVFCGMAPRVFMGTEAKDERMLRTLGVTHVLDTTFPLQTSRFNDSLKQTYERLGITYSAFPIAGNKTLPSEQLFVSLIRKLRASITQAPRPGMRKYVLFIQDYAVMTGAAAVLIALVASMTTASYDAINKRAQDWFINKSARLNFVNNKTGEINTTTLRASDLPFGKKLQPFIQRICDVSLAQPTIIESLGRVRTTPASSSSSTSSSPASASSSSPSSSSSTHANRSFDARAILSAPSVSKPAPRWKDTPRSNKRHAPGDTWFDEDSSASRIREDEEHDPDGFNMPSFSSKRRPAAIDKSLNDF